MTAPDSLLLSELTRRAMEEQAPQEATDLDGPSEGEFFDVHAHPWRLADGRLGGVIVLAIDVSIVRRRERELRLLNHELAQLTYRASHDLVAPLRTSLGWLGMIREDLDNRDLDAAREGVARAEAGLLKLSDRVRQLSELALADAEEEPVALVQLRELVDEVLSRFESVEGVELQNRVAEGTRLRVPPKRLRAVLRRLVDNGARFARPESDSRFVRVETTAQRPGSIRVLDNGIGLPDESVDIFGLFVRGVSGYDGHGLGLHIARKHMRTMGGDLTVDRSAQNTTLVMQLPKGAWE